MKQTKACAVLALVTCAGLGVGQASNVDSETQAKRAMYASVVRQLLGSTLRTVELSPPLFVDVNTSDRVADAVVAALLDEGRYILPASVCREGRAGDGGCQLGPIIIFGPISLHGRTRGLVPAVIVTRNASGGCGFECELRRGKWESTPDKECVLYPREQPK